jgi:hypothetical protein
MLHNNTIDLHFAYGPVFGVNYSQRRSFIAVMLQRAQAIIQIYIGSTVRFLDKLLQPPKYVLCVDGLCHSLTPSPAPLHQLEDGALAT